jgi:hypothetical protein
MLPDYINYQAFAKLVFPEAKDPVRKWKNKRDKIGRARFLPSDIEKIKAKLLELSDDLKNFKVEDIV